MPMGQSGRQRHQHILTLTPVTRGSAICSLDSMSGCSPNSGTIMLVPSCTWLPGALPRKSTTLPVNASPAGTLAISYSLFVLGPLSSSTTCVMIDRYHIHVLKVRLIGILVKFVLSALVR